MSWPECASCRQLLEQVELLRADLADAQAEAANVRTELVVERSRRTLGGTPPGYWEPGGWVNVRLPGGVHGDYEGRL